MNLLLALWMTTMFGFVVAAAYIPDDVWAAIAERIRGRNR